MVESVERMDEMVKDYLLFRGMTNSFKAFEIDLKNDKDRSFRVRNPMFVPCVYMLITIFSHDLSK